MVIYSLWFLFLSQIIALHRIGGYAIMNSRRGSEMDPELENEMVSEDSCCSHPHGRRSHHSEKTKKNLVTRLNRIEGQIRGIKRLIESDTYCDDVITQISASQAALNGVAKILLEAHMKECVVRSHSRRRYGSFR